MNRFLAVCVLLCFLATGCQQSVPPSFAKYDLDGGRYFVEVENTDGGTSLNFHSYGEGKEVKDELYDLSWGKSHRLKINNGNLTIDDVDYGKLQPGDQIVVKASGDTFVNGTKR